ITFSFSATITEQFQLGSASTPPWHVTSSAPSHPQQLRHQVLRARSRQLRRSARRALPLPPHVRPVGARRPLGLAATGDQVKIGIYLAPSITKAKLSDIQLQPPAQDQDVVAACAMLLMQVSDAPALYGQLLKSLTVDGSGNNVVTYAVLDQL